MANPIRIIGPDGREPDIRHLFTGSALQSGGGGGNSNDIEKRLAKLEEDAAEGVVEDAGAEIGLRSRADVLARIAHLQADAAEPPISRSEAEVLDVILSLRESLPNAHQNLRDITVDLPGMTPSVERMARRMDALAAAGISVEDLPFEASFGRTTLEYYDGFVFGFYEAARPDLPPVATGGRYDALTRQLGGGAEIPAVGGVIRPGLVIDLGGAA